MPGFELVPEAESDLSEIWRYGFETWGEAQADRYFDDILSCFEAIATGRAKTKALTDILPDIHVHRCRYHRIFFLPERPVVILSLFPPRDACAYAFVFQRVSEPVRIIDTISEKPLNLRQVAQHGRRADVVTDLSGRNEEVERATVAVADGVQLRVQAAFGASNQTPALAFIPRSPGNPLISLSGAWYFPYKS